MSKLSSLQFQSLIDVETLFILYLHSTDYFSHHDFTETIALLRDAASQKSPNSEKEGSPKSPKSVELICQLSNASLWESPLVGDAIRSLTRLLSNEDSRCVAENVVADLLRQFPCFDTSLVLLLPFLGELMHSTQKSPCFSLFIDVACELLPASFSSLTSFLLLALRNSCTDLLLAKLPILLQRAPFSSHSASLEYALFLSSLNSPSLVPIQNTLFAAFDASRVPGSLFQLLEIACSRGLVAAKDILDLLPGESLDEESKARLVCSLFQKRLLKMEEIAPFVSSLLSSDSILVQSTIVQIYFENWIQCSEIDRIQYYELLPSFLTVLRHDVQQSEILLRSLFQVFCLPKLIDFDSILCTLSEVMNLQTPSYSLKNHCLALQAIAVYLEKREWSGDVPFWRQQLGCICSLAKDSHRQNAEYSWSMLVKCLQSICNNPNYKGASRKEIQLFIQDFFSE